MHASRWIRVALLASTVSAIASREPPPPSCESGALPLDATSAPTEEYDLLARLVEQSTSANDAVNAQARRISEMATKRLDEIKLRQEDLDLQALRGCVLFLETVFWKFKMSVEFYETIYLDPCFQRVADAPSSVCNPLQQENDDEYVMCRMVRNQCLRRRALHHLGLA